MQLPKDYNSDSEEVKTLSSKIKKSRTEKGYNIYSFSALLAIPEQQLKDIESGKIPPDIYLFEKISRYTGKSMEWFFRE
ncbi:MAG: helix-turn-helix transcriptional regulator [Endomicrobium sp.]|jgi:transcriptional regulator with XRE-family HTH domain|nr:helix-turn-helix transcriptional regulator [Endomicrobium sp.]